MNAILSKPAWHGICKECERAITFSPEKPMIADEHEYVCNCGCVYWIDRGTGFYTKITTKIND